MAGGMCESKAVYCLGAALLVVGMLLLAVFCSEYIPGYNYSKDFTQGTCDIHSSAISVNVCCEASAASAADCDEDYLYPCVLVVANVSDSSDQAIFYDEVDSALFGGRITDCSYFHCDSSSYEDRLKDVTAFLNDHQPGSSHDCYYGQKDDAGRALKSTITSGVLLPSLLISILIILAGLITCIVMYLIDRLHGNGDDDIEVPPSEQNLKQDHDDDSDIETIEISTTVTTVSARSGKSSAKSSIAPGSPIKRSTSISGHK